MLHSKNGGGDGVALEGGGGIAGKRVSTVTVYMCLLYPANVHPKVLCDKF